MGTDKIPINSSVLGFDEKMGKREVVVMMVEGNKQPPNVPPSLQYDHFGGSPHFILERNLASN